MVRDFVSSASFNSTFLGLEDITIPNIAHGSKLAAAIAPEDLTAERRELQRIAAKVVASIKMHGRKPF